MGRPKVLIVEDDPSFQSLFARELMDEAVLLQAYDIAKGERYFMENQDVSLIAMDACVRCPAPNTHTLVQKIRGAGFSGPMVAISHSLSARWKLTRAGCDYSCPKEDAAWLVRKLLGMGK
jgi:DNA-binding response OmpR family regulator